MSAFWIILTGSLVAATCAILGSFLLLRKMSMLGDAISHSVLPGIAAAFILSGSRESIFLIAGAAVFGVFTVFLVEWMHKKLRMQADASIGMTYTFLFAVGVILISLFAGKVDLDQDCVLYGEIAFVSLDTWITPSGVVLGPVKVWITGIMLLLTILFVLFSWKELKITTFDPSFAQASGIKAVRWHYILMGMVSLATVTAFDSVGAILVVAFLTVPAAAAFLLTRRLNHMIYIAVIIGVLASAGGYFLASMPFINASISGSMAVVAGVIFFIAWGISRIRIHAK